MKNRFYGAGLLMIAVLASVVIMAPGCGEDSCGGASSKICEKACACGDKCTVGAVDFDSKAGCTVALSTSCNPTKPSFDYAACSAALDTAECVDGKLQIPKECSKESATDEDGGADTSSSSSGTM